MAIRKNSTSRLTCCGKRLSIWLLVGYLSILLSCGSTLHRLPGLGHHPFSSDCSPEETPSAPVCSCGQHSIQVPSQEMETAAELFAAEPQKESNCLICKFFEDFQGSINSLTFAFTDAPGCWRRKAPPSDDSHLDIHSQARGPPIA